MGLNSISVETKPLCLFCGKRGLKWKREHRQWILFEKKSSHRCPNHPLSMNQMKKLAENGKIEYVLKRRSENLKRALCRNGVKYLISNGIKTPELIDLIFDLAEFFDDVEKQPIIKEIKAEIIRRVK